MTLNSFVLKREQTWLQLQAILSRVESRGLKNLAENELDDLVRLYRQASSDLNYLQTHFHASRYTTYLNNLLSRCHTYIQVEDSPFLPRLKRFLITGFPALLRQEKMLFFLSVALFIAAFCFAYFSISRDAPWSAGILDPGTRAALEENAATMEEEGAVIPAAMQPLFAGHIVTNNIQVAFLCFAGGIIFGLGTVYVLAMNGFILGAFAAIFALHRRSLLFWTLILPHGIMELTAIFIAAASGLLLGRALLLPGDYSRRDSLRLAGRSAARLVGGTIPLFIMAAAIESFFTPTGLPIAAKLSFAAFSAAALVLYFLPRRSRKRKKAQPRQLTTWP